MQNPQLYEFLFQAGAPMCSGPAEVIFQEGETAQGAYVLQSGRAELSFVTERRPLMWSHTAGPGAIGLAPAMVGSTHLFTAVTVEETTMSFIPRDELRDLVYACPLVGLDIVHALSAEAMQERRSLLLQKRNSPTR